MSKNNKTLKLTKKDFNEAIESADKVIIKFGAIWCSPCKLLAKVLDDIEFPDNIKVYSVDVDEEQDLCEENEINAVPTIFVYKKGSLIKKAFGLISKKEIEDIIKM